MSELEKLVAKAREMEAKVLDCEKQGGHNYSVQGFSHIAHPELMFQAVPSVKKLSDVVFSSYYCTNCGNRVSVKEGRDYMRNKARKAG